MKKIILFIICFQLISLSNAIAADIYLRGNSVSLNGEIKKGDYEKFKEVIIKDFIEQTVSNQAVKYAIENEVNEIIVDGEKTELKFSDSEKRDIEILRSAFNGELSPKFFNIRSINLNSQGGSVLEAMMIGDSVHKFLMPTEINGYFSEDESCQSSCFLIWASGVERTADTRTRHPELSKVIGELQINDLGIHRVYFDPSEYSQYSSFKAMNTYSNAKEVVSDFLDSMNIDKAIIEKVWKIPSNEIYFLTGKEKKSLVGTSPFYEELLISRCGSYDDDDKKLLRECKYTYPILLTNNQVSEGVYAYTDSVGDRRTIGINSNRKTKLLRMCPSITPSKIESLLSSYDFVDDCKRVHSHIMRWEAVNAAFGITKKYPKLLGESGDFYLNAHIKGFKLEQFK